MDKQVSHAIFGIIAIIAMVSAVLVVEGRSIDPRGKSIMMGKQPIPDFQQRLIAAERQAHAMQRGSQQVYPGMDVYRGGGGGYGGMPTLNKMRRSDVSTGEMLDSVYRGGGGGHGGMPVYQQNIDAMRRATTEELSRLQKQKHDEAQKAIAEIRY